MTPLNVLITGAARGIGYGIAQCFAEQGANLIIADADESAAQDAVASLMELGASGVLGVGCDITQRAQVEGMAHQAGSTLGRIPIRRIGTPQDIGNACIFLASPGAEYISGVSLHVDGGYQTMCA